jgi:predicted MFS family arabinose efflux permease
MRKPGLEESSGASARRAASDSGLLARVTLLRALRHREYRLLFSAFVINQVGFWVSHISLQGLMADLTDSDPFRLGMFFFALFSPAFFLAPIAGVAADRFDRKRIMLVCYAALATVMLGLALLCHAELATANLLLLIGSILGATFAFSGPASAAVAANAVQPEDLSSAVSLQSAANNLTRVLGPAVAAPLIASRSYAVSFGVFGTAAVTAGLLTAFMRLSPYEREIGGGGVLARVKGGLVHARERKPAIPALVTVGVLSIFGVSHIALLPAFAQGVLGDKDLFAWLVAATGIGAMCGAISTSNESKPSLRKAAVRLALYGCAVAVFASTRHFMVALVAQLVVGYFYFAVMTGLQTLLQQVVDESKRGRVMSLFQVAWAGLTPFGALAMGALAKTIGVAATITAAAAVCFSFGCLMTMLAKPRPAS